MDGSIDGSPSLCAGAGGGRANTCVNIYRYIYQAKSSQVKFITRPEVRGLEPKIYIHIYKLGRAGDGRVGGRAARAGRAEVHDAGRGGGRGQGSREERRAAGSGARTESCAAYTGQAREWGAKIRAAAADRAAAP
mmetsp:Transcript_88849/g.236578  ORF Transcript_88849/g.236578 Transcript_88849/m.236578 type:complete len:135 (+) Transcript_88849:209-613(+)